MLVRFLMLINIKIVKKIKNVNFDQFRRFQNLENEKF